MAGKKFGVVMTARVPASYHGMSAAEQAKPGKAVEKVFKKYAGRVEMLRRYWTSAFSSDVTDVFIIEADDMADVHAFNDDLNKEMARLGGDPDRYGTTVGVLAGINPDADAPKKRGGRR